MTMKKILPVLLALFLLEGCKIDAEIRPDTIVDIPIDPTEDVTEEITEETEPTTEAPTEEPTEAPTSPPTQKPTEKPKDSSNKTTSKKPSTKKPSNEKKEPYTKATEATKATQPPTDPPTEPPTDPPTEAPTVAPTIDSYSPTKLDKAIIAAVNAKRAEAGLAELGTSQKLSAAAAQRAVELSISWSHTRLDGSDFSTVLGEFGINADHCGECLHNSFTAIDGDELVDRWMERESNHDTILSEKFHTIGVASYSCDGVTYIAALFIG